MSRYFLGVHLLQKCKNSHSLSSTPAAQVWPWERDFYQDFFLTVFPVDTVWVVVYYTINKESQLIEEQKNKFRKQSLFKAMH